MGTTPSTAQRNGAAASPPASVQLQSKSGDSTAGNERSALLSEDFYGQQSGDTARLQRKPIASLTHEEVLERAAELAEAAKLPARTSSSVRQPATCSNASEAVAMRAAIKKEDLAQLRSLLEAHRHAMEARDMVRPPLLLRARGPRCMCVRVCGADHGHPQVFWRTMLHIAAAAGKTDAVHVLLHSGAYVDAQDKVRCMHVLPWNWLRGVPCLTRPWLRWWGQYGDTPYDLAKRYRHRRTAAVLKTARKAYRQRIKEVTGEGSDSAGQGRHDKERKKRKHRRKRTHGPPSGAGVGAGAGAGAGVGAGVGVGAGRHRRKKRAHRRKRANPGDTIVGGRRVAAGRASTGSATSLVPISEGGGCSDQDTDGGGDAPSGRAGSDSASSSSGTDASGASDDDSAAGASVRSPQPALPLLGGDATRRTSLSNGSADAFAWQPAPSQMEAQPKTGQPRAACAAEALRPPQPVVVAPPQ